MHILYIFNIINTLNITVNIINNSYKDFEIKPASLDRDWMKANNNHAYKCLPLKIANKFGWNILCPIDFTAEWNGALYHKDSFKLNFNGEDEAKAKEYTQSGFIGSHFGNGILTFSLPFIIKTPKNIGIFVRGPTNHIKENISYLDGFIETDWLDFTFTYNIKFQQAKKEVSFKKGEPICSFFPFQLPWIEDIQFIYQNINKNKQLKDNYLDYGKKRLEFNKNLENYIKKDNKQIWMKDYYNGQKAENKSIGCPFLDKFGKFLHKTNLNLKEIKDE